ncbi:MAG: transglycosylase SLT domain-containing protein, partial [Gemmatimonadota bacterium]
MRMRAGDRILAALCVIVVASGMACAPKQPPATSPQAEGSATSPQAEASAPSDARKGAEAGQAEEGTQADTPPLNPSQVSADDEPARPAASGNAPGLTPDPTADDGVSDAQLMDAEAQRSVEALDEATRREFLEMFGSDPLGLALHPDNARYELPLEMNEKVERWIEYFQAKIPERFTTYLERLGRYGPMIRGRLRAASLPEDLIYLALIESGLNPRAYSRARAVGIWQFIRGTGRLYGLKVDYWVDERRDPFKSTDAAVAHLSDLY